MFVLLLAADREINLLYCCSHLRSSVIKTTDHQYNLTRYIWPDESSYMDVFYVTVTAEQGSNRSEPVQSKTFSFNTLKTTDIKCE